MYYAYRIQTLAINDLQPHQSSTERILPVSLRLNFLQCTEVQEVIWPVSLVVEGVGVGQLDAISHPLVESDTLEIVVPAAHIRHHVEAHEPGQDETK